MPWMDSAGDWHETDTSACGDFPECHDETTPCGCEPEPYDSTYLAAHDGSAQRYFTENAL